VDLLEFQSLTVGYNDIPVITEISLAVSKAEIVALLGPNGAGKSTLLKALTGEARIFSGSVLLRGEDVTGWAPEHLARMGVGYVPQNDNVFPSLTVLENLEMGAFLAPRRQVRQKIEAILQQFPPLRALLRRDVSQLSGGERRLVASSVLTEYVTHVAEAGTGVLLVEQRAKEALEIAHLAYVMSGGRIEVSGSPSALLERADIGRLFLGESLRKPG
jgi:branched-chain amino acid transport system ATP-binding protein